MNVWKAFLLLQVSANPLSTKEQTGPAAMRKPIRNRQGLPGRQAPTSAWQRVPQEKTPCLERSAWLMCDTGSVQVSYCRSLPPTYCLKQRPLLQLTRDPCIMLNKAALLLLEVSHKGPGLFLLGSTYWFVIQYWQLSSGAQQNHSAYSPCHRNNIHLERLGED